jgi:alpha-D-ribose 1-methylphosphonate 5-phosphate C-P lyase
MRQEAAVSGMEDLSDDSTMVSHTHRLPHIPRRENNILVYS